MYNKLEYMQYDFKQEIWNGPTKSSCRLLKNEPKLGLDIEFSWWWWWYAMGVVAFK